LFVQPIYFTVHNNVSYLTLIDLVFNDLAAES